MSLHYIFSYIRLISSNALTPAWYDKIESPLYSEYLVQFLDQIEVMEHAVLEHILQINIIFRDVEDIAPKANFEFTFESRTVFPDIDLEENIEEVKKMLIFDITNRNYWQFISHAIMSLTGLHSPDPLLLMPPSQEENLSRYLTVNKQPLA